jgi:hypothetical protein
VTAYSLSGACRVVATRDSTIEEEHATNGVEEAVDALVVDWANASRGRLEAAARRGAVAVHFEKGKLRLVPYCSSRAKYSYAGLSPKNEQLTIKDESELKAALPTFGLSFEGALRGSAQLGVSMTIVGRFESGKEALDVASLEGDCSDVTHVISGMSVGAFDVHKGSAGHASGGVSLGNAGVTGAAPSELDSLNKDGDTQSCSAAKASDSPPPDACAALVRVELRRISSRPAPPAPQMPWPIPKNKEKAYCRLALVR